jgi:hypothetical protein
VYGSAAPGSGEKTSPWSSAPCRFGNETGVMTPRVPSQPARYGFPLFQPGTSWPGVRAGRFGRATCASRSAANSGLMVASVAMP